MTTKKKCKNCERFVQPGLTKMLTEYDTCCRSCAKYPGQGKHDENCSGQQSEFSNAVPSVDDPSILMADLVNNNTSLRAYATNAFGAASQGHARLGYQQLKVALETLMAPFGGLPPNTRVGKLKEDFDADEDGMIDLEEFLALSTELFAKEGARWFPILLPVSTTSFVIQNPNSLEDEYTLGKKLGEGTFGQVFRCTHKVSDEVRVVKKVSKTLAGMDTAEILEEISNMAQLDHPNVVKVYEWFEDDEYISQIMEPLGGGELQDRIVAVFQDGTAPFYGEGFIADVIKQTLRALAFMHSRRFMHKDLKPQNIMMVDKESSSIKVIDFGLAEMFGETQHVAEQFGGTLLYTAPEGAKALLGMPEMWGFQGLVFKSDIWSTGVILYQLITGSLPFMGQWPPPTGDVNAWQTETLQKIVTIPMPRHESLSKVSSECVQLLASMLDKELPQRPDASQCLRSAWFAKIISPPAPLSPGIIQSLYGYSRVSEMKRAMFLLMAQLSSMPAVSQLREIYTHFDVRNQGTLENADLRQVLSQGGMKASEVQRAIKALDRSGSGNIVWTEFLAGALCFKLSNSKRLIDAAFAFYDDDAKNAITIEDIENKLAVDPVPAAWQALWQTHLPAEYTAAKEEIDDDLEPAHAGPCSWLCGPNETDEDELSKSEFQTWMCQKLRQKSGDKYFSVD